MKRTLLGKGIRIGAAVVLFGGGWFCGSLTQPTAEAQLDDIKKSIMQKATDQGGAIGAAAKLGTTISDIQTHLDALQENVDTLKGVQSMIGG